MDEPKVELSEHSKQLIEAAVMQVVVEATIAINRIVSLSVEEIAKRIVNGQATEK